MASERLTTWLAENCWAGRVIVRVGRRGDELIAEFSNLGELSTSAKGTKVHFEPVAGADTAMLEKMRTTMVDAFVRHAQGKVTLHGGAVGLNSKAVAFIGPSRSGKSTLAAALCAEAGIGLVADDTVALELPESPSPATCVEVIPTQRTAWLLPEARGALGFDRAIGGKVPVKLPVGTSHRLKLAAVVDLVFDSKMQAPELRRIRGQRAFSALFNSAIRFVVDDPDGDLREFDQLRTVIGMSPVYELRRPFDLQQLQQSAHQIRQLLGGPAPPRA